MKLMAEKKSPPGTFSSARPTAVEFSQLTHKFVSPKFARRMPLYFFVSVGAATVLVDGAAAGISKMTRTMTGQARGADFRTVGDADEQVATSAARLGQTFATGANNFVAPNAARDLHTEHRAGHSRNHFRAALRRAFGFDP